MLMSPVFEAAVQYCSPQSKVAEEGGIALFLFLYLLLFYGYNLLVFKGTKRNKDDKYMKDVSGEKSPLV